MSKLDKVVSRVNEVVTSYDGDEVFRGDGKLKTTVWVQTTEEVESLKKSIEKIEAEESAVIYTKSGYQSPDYSVDDDEDPPCRFVIITIPDDENDWGRSG